MGFEGSLWESVANYIVTGQLLIIVLHFLVLHEEKLRMSLQTK